MRPATLLQVLFSGKKLLNSFSWFLYFVIFVSFSCRFFCFNREAKSFWASLDKPISLPKSSNSAWLDFCGASFLISGRSLDSSLIYSPSHCLLKLIRFSPASTGISLVVIVFCLVALNFIKEKTHLYETAIAGWRRRRLEARMLAPTSRGY